MDHIEIFRTGRHTDVGGQTVSFGEAELAATAAAYDPKLHEAPIVVGHPSMEAPAYGWVGGISVVGDRLQATPTQVDPAFAELVRAGRFKRVSASFYAPDSPSNPKPGVYYLRHVGFLGAQPPAVKGLKAVSFADAEQGVLEFADGWSLNLIAALFRRMRDFLIARHGQEVADATLHPDSITALTEQAAVELQRDNRPTSFSEVEKPSVTTPSPGGTPSPTLPPEAEAELTRLRKQVSDFAEADAKRRRADDAAFLDGLQKSGRLVPANRALAAGLLARLDGGDAVSFAEGRAAETPRDALRALLAAQPAAVSFGEFAGGAGDGTAAGDPHALSRAARELQDAEAKAGRDISFAEAVERVSQKKAA